MRLEGWQIIIVIVLAVLLFGAPKLPGLARSVGQSLRIFKSEVKQLKDENNGPAPQAAPGGPAPQPAPLSPGSPAGGSAAGEHRHQEP